MLECYVDLTIGDGNSVSMQKVILTVIFIIITMGSFAVIAMVPFLVRDFFRRRNSNKRQNGFAAGVADRAKNLPIVVTLVPTKESIVTSYKSYLRRRNGSIVTLFFSLFMLGGVAVGCYTFYDKFVIENDEASGVVLFQSFIALFALYGYHIRPLMHLRRLKRLDDTEINEAESVRLVLKDNHILIGCREVSDVIPWDLVNYIERKGGRYLIFVLSNKDSILVSCEDDFERGDWDELRSFVKPLTR